MYIHVCMYVCIYIYICIYIYKAKWTPIKSFYQAYNIKLLLKPVVKPWKSSLTEAFARTSQKRWLQRPSVMKTASRCHRGNRASRFDVALFALWDRYSRYRLPLPGIFVWVFWIRIQRTDYHEISFDQLVAVYAPLTSSAVARSLFCLCCLFLIPHPPAHLWLTGKGRHWHVKTINSDWHGIDMYKEEQPWKFRLVWRKCINLKVCLFSQFSCVSIRLVPRRHFPSRWQLH